MTTKRMSAGETQSLIALLKCDCHCEDNVDAEQEYDGSWRGSFSICTSCKAATALSALSADLEAARGAALEEAAKTCRDEMERARRLGAGRDAALIPNMDLVTAGREDSASRILAAIRAPEGAERCLGSGEIGVDVLGRFERAGPVPDDAKSFHVSSCWDCGGLGVKAEIIHD